MRENKKVSIIVPVYNSREYLGYCLNSIVSQTYKNLEIILVNDGSTDGSLEICRNYEAVDRRIKVIDIPNGGVSNARNIGIENATGEYIQFTDSDDVISSEMIGKLVEAIEVYEADIVFCGMKVVYREQVIDEFNSKFLGVECVFTDEQFSKGFPYLLIHSVMLEGPCNRLYRLDILKENKISFPLDVSLGEDFIMNLKYYSLCERFVFLSESYYYYLQHDKSLTRKYRADMLENRKLLLEEYMAFMNSKRAWTDDGKRYFASYVIGYMISVLKNIFSEDAILNENEIKREVFKVINYNLFRENWERANWIDEKYLFLRDCLVNNDVGMVCVKMKEFNNTSQVIDMGPLVEPIVRNPGRLNKCIVKILGKVNNVFKSKKISKLKFSIIDNGLKFTFLKIIKRR